MNRQKLLSKEVSNSLKALNDSLNSRGSGVAGKSALSASGNSLGNSVAIANANASALVHSANLVNSVDKSEAQLQKINTGIRLENIVPCFVSSHIRKLCEDECWANWKESIAESLLNPDIPTSDDDAEKPSQEDIFIAKTQSYIQDMQPSAIETFAAVVMVDVSGYSKLSASLAERGAEGAEILCRTMKGYLDRVNTTNQDY